MLIVQKTISRVIAFKMKHIVSILASLISLISAKPGYLSIPVGYATLTSDVQLDHHSALLDNPEAAVTRAQHIDVNTNDRINLDPGRMSVSRVQSLSQLPSLLFNDNTVILTSPAPLGADGRVVDTAEVTAAKLAHAAAHVNERLNLANEAARSAGVSETVDHHHGNVIITTESAADRRVLRPMEVSTAKTIHAIEHDRRKINLAKENVRSTDGLTRITDESLVPLVLDNGIVAALLPVGYDGRPLYASKVHLATPVNQKDKTLGNDVKPVDALAVAGPSLAYRRLIY